MKWHTLIPDLSHIENYGINDGKKCAHPKHYFILILGSGNFSLTWTCLANSQILALFLLFWHQVILAEPGHA